jgi:hypothetical protein
MPVCRIHVPHNILQGLNPDPEKEAQRAVSMQQIKDPMGMTIDMVTIPQAPCYRLYDVEHAVID